jgi:hypothetical protein
MNCRPPVRCSICQLPFEDRKPARQLALLDDELALCSECHWWAQHPGEGIIHIPDPSWRTAGPRNTRFVS